MRPAPRDPLAADDLLSIERFDYTRIGSEWAVIRMTARLRDELGLPEGARLALHDGGPDALHAPARACVTERRLGLAPGEDPELLWRAAFAIPAPLVCDPQVRFALLAAGGRRLTLPAPVLGAGVLRRLPVQATRVSARPSPALVRRRAAALATAAALTTTSTPAVALASSVTHSSHTGVGHPGGPVGSALDPEATVAGPGASNASGSLSSTVATPASTTEQTTSTPAPAGTTGATGTTAATGTTGTSGTTAPTGTTPAAPAPTTTSTTTPPPAATTSTPTAPAPTSSSSTATGQIPAPVVKPGHGHPTSDTTGASVTRLSSSPSRAGSSTGSSSTTSTGSKPPGAAGAADGQPSHWGQDTLNARTHAAVKQSSVVAQPGSRHSATPSSAPSPSTATTSTGAGAPVSQLSSTPGYAGPSAWTGTVTSNPAIAGAVRNLAGELSNANRPPSFLIPIYMEAAKRYHLPWEVLAAINAVESDYGRDLNTSSAGAIGWMQFEPSTWKEYGMAVDGVSEANPYDPRDAIFAAARYLHAAGGSTDIQRAVFAYNHAGWYVDEVMERAHQIASTPQFAATGTSHRGNVTVDFDTGKTVRTHQGRKRPLRIRYQGGLMSHYDRLVAAANMVSAADFPYLWGGGHEQPARFGPFDCSGAVSYVMQQAGYKVDTTVAADVGSWHLPTGPGKVTIFYDNVHTFMRIGGRYFGTSGFARPGGGAGWFDADKLPENYLAEFHEVHLPRLGGDSFAPTTGLAKLALKRFERFENRGRDPLGTTTILRFGASGPHAFGGVR